MLKLDYSVQNNIYVQQFAIINSILRKFLESCIHLQISVMEATHQNQSI